MSESHKKEGNIMRSGDIFSDSVPPVTNYVRTVCSVCKEPINIDTIYQINGVSSCSFCYTDHNLSRNVCPRPYRIPHPRKLTNRIEAQRRTDAWMKEMGLAQGTTTFSAVSERFNHDPNGGL